MWARHRAACYGPYPVDLHWCTSGDGPSPLVISLRGGQEFGRGARGRCSPVTREAKLKGGLVEPCGRSNA